MRVTRRRLVGLFGGAGAGLVALAAVAYACTNLATLNLSTSTGRPGSQVTVTGSAFGAICVCGPQMPPTPVTIRWGGIQGQVLVEVTPDRPGTLSAAFTVPDAKPGYYVIVATQRDANTGIDTYGTPARATFEILGPRGESVVNQSELEVATATEDSVSTGLVAFTIGLGVAGLALLAGGSAAVIRQLRGRKVPAAARISVE